MKQDILDIKQYDGDGITGERISHLVDNNNGMVRISGSIKHGNCVLVTKELIKFLQQVLDKKGDVK